MLNAKLGHRRQTSKRLIYDINFVVHHGRLIPQLINCLDYFWSSAMEQPTVLLQ